MVVLMRGGPWTLRCRRPWTPTQYDVRLVGSYSGFVGANRRTSLHLERRHGRLSSSLMSSMGWPPRHIATPPALRSFSTITMTTTHLIVEKIPIKAIAIIRFNRPKALNALCNELCTELVDQLKELDKDDTLRAIVVIGVGRSFAAGADIKQMVNYNFVSASREDFLHTWNQIQTIRKPLIAAVNGYALGGGCELTMMCDVVLAASSAKFSQPEILIGTIPGMGGSQRLPRIVGKSRAMEWILTGNQFTAEEACQAGLVSRVVPDESLEETAVQLAEKMARNSLPALIAAKECVNRAYESSLQEGLLYERRIFHSTFARTDRTEGMTAFSEKRQPHWSHE